MFQLIIVYVMLPVDICNYCSNFGQEFCTNTAIGVVTCCQQMFIHRVHCRQSKIYTGLPEYVPTPSKNLLLQGPILSLGYCPMVVLPHVHMHPRASQVVLPLFLSKLFLWFFAMDWSPIYVVFTVFLGKGFGFTTKLKIRTVNTAIPEILWSDENDTIRNDIWASQSVLFIVSY